MYTWYDVVWYHCTNGLVPRLSHVIQHIHEVPNFFVCTSEKKIWEGLDVRLQLYIVHSKLFHPSGCSLEYLYLV